MSLISGRFKNYKNESLGPYLREIGVPFVLRPIIEMSSPVTEFRPEGENMTIKISSLFVTNENTFKVGEEYAEKVPTATMKSRATIIKENEIVIDSVLEHHSGKADFKRHIIFSEDGCVEHLTHSKGKTAAKRFYQRMKED